ncbi:hypothetical protein [Nocardia sp. NPDC046763]|uniref:hypothetical protein n=1 Tax=Nocardia sp. NPDC046763 TaxID=3155256 RepID=UPI0033C15C0A
MSDRDLIAEAYVAGHLDGVIHQALDAIHQVVGVKMPVPTQKLKRAIHDATEDGPVMEGVRKRLRDLGVGE